jgi:hypothetical protein
MSTSNQNPNEKGLTNPNSQKQAGNSKDKLSENMFILESLFLDVNNIFSPRVRPVKDIVYDCLVVLDTSILLDPYNYRTLDFIESFIDDFKKVLSPLAKNKRLFIPGHVVREFAKGRGVILTGLYNNLMELKKPEGIQGIKSSLLATLAEYKELIDLTSQINRLIGRYPEAISLLIKRTETWLWNDPISQLYNEVVSSENIIDWPPDNEKEKFKEDFNWRLKYGIPPVTNSGDRKKEDGGVGDLIIWHTILHLAETNKKDLIFVSNDIKSDWWYSISKEKSKKPLYPRFELIDEFRRKSDGHTLHIIKLSELFDLFGASNDTVKKIRLEEESSYVPTQMWSSHFDGKDSVLAVKRWLEDHFKNYSVLVQLPFGPETCFDFILRNSSEEYSGVAVLPVSSENFNISLVKRFKLSIEDEQVNIIDPRNNITILLTSDEKEASEISEVIKEVGQPNSLGPIIVGYFDKFVFIETLII